MLSGVNVALGITGSIAAVKVVELAHELRRRGAAVRGVMTESARSVIHPWSVEFATDATVVTEITGGVEHIELCGTDGWADVFLIAPATANTVGKIAAAIDDSPVTTCATTALGAGVPVVVAPAMHAPMYDHPGVNDAVDRLESWGVSFVDPRLEEGKAKIAMEDTIALAVARAVGNRPLAGTRIVVTSGATSEPIDPVRVLSNRSSGKTGRAIAKALYVRGAEVTLVHDGPDVPYATVSTVETAAEMVEAVEDAMPKADGLVSAAAIGDFTVTPRSEKIRSDESVTLELEPTPKLIDAIREEYPDRVIIGFKAETSGDDEAMVAEARRILDRAALSFVVANDASVMGQDQTRALFVFSDDVESFSGSKIELGLRLADEFADCMD